MVRGHATIIDRGREHESALEALRVRYQQYRDMGLENRPVIGLTPERVSSWGDLG
jgi:hypothetical protein